VADAAGGEPDEDLARARLREVDLLDDKWLPELLENRCPDAHAQSLAQPRTLRDVHLGVILPNYGRGSSPDGIRRVASAAEEAGFDSIWTTEHIVVGPDERADPYRRVYDPLVTLGWIAGWTERIGLGTSIVILPLHNPFHLAKQATTLQELSAGRLVLGVGMGWYEREYGYMGVEFQGRGRRGDEAIRLMRALWSGERSFHGDDWSFDDATSDPLPSPIPEIWVGGSSERAIRRARELGDVWHPSRGSSVDHIRSVKERYPELRVVARTSLENVDALIEAGVEGVVVTFPDETAMRDFARRYR
jgi:probable F420-dependent oxidoreductase